MGYFRARRILKNHRQPQVLRFYRELDRDRKKQLIHEIETMDFSMVDAASRSAAGGAAEVGEAPVWKITEVAPREEALRERGLKAIADGQVAAVVLAGGQGTRLGYDGPKGAYYLNKEKKISIFELLIYNLNEVNRAAGTTVPFCVMTSRINDGDTKAFFEANAYFGYPKDKVYFFMQDMAPALDKDGKILLETKSLPAMAPNGNGGWFSSLKRSGLLDSLEKQGVRWLNVFSVDNVLQRIADPVFLGLVLEDGNEAGAKVIAKANPEERVGALCLKDGHPSVVEYSELSDEMRYSKNEKGDYRFNFGVTLNYYFEIGAMRRYTEKTGMPVHKAFKKIACLDETGKTVSPDAPNAYKLETFIFDILEAFPAVTAQEVEREKEFAPIKNAEGVDSPETARALLKAQRPDWDR